MTPPEAPAPVGSSEDGWIAWAGGECPVDPETLVSVKLADGDPGWMDEALPAGTFGDEDPDFDWWRGDGLCAPYRIIAYRVVQP